MNLPEPFKEEVSYRSRIAQNANYSFSVAVVELHKVSDSTRFLDALKDHVKEYNNCVPSDKIMRGELPNELYIVMRGEEPECLWKLSQFFGSPGVRPQMKDISLIARLGISQYQRGKTPLELIQEAYVRPMSYEIGNVTASPMESGFIIPEVKSKVSKVS